MSRYPNCTAVDNKSALTEHVRQQFLTLPFFDAAGNIIPCRLVDSQAEAYADGLVIEFLSRCFNVSTTLGLNRLLVVIEAKQEFCLSLHASRIKGWQRNRGR